jgi:hypothetical protein
MIRLVRELQHVVLAMQKIDNLAMFCTSHVRQLEVAETSILDRASSSPGNLDFNEVKKRTFLALHPRINISGTKQVVVSA